MAKLKLLDSDSGQFVEKGLFKTLTDNEWTPKRIKLYNRTTGEWDVIWDDKPKTYIFGFDQNFNVIDRNTQITYPNDVINSSYTPMIVNPSRGTPTVGDWGFFISDILKNKPYMVKRNGEADYELDPNDYSKKLDGSTSDAYNSNYSGGAFAWLEGLYTKEWYTEDGDVSSVTGDVRHVRYTNIVPEGEEDDWVPVMACWKGTTKETASKGIFIPISVGDKSVLTNLTIRTNPTQDYVNVDTLKGYSDGFLSSGSGALAVPFGGGIGCYIRDLMYMMGKTTDLCSASGAFAYDTFGGSIDVTDANDIFPGFFTDMKSEGASNKCMTRVFHSFLPFGIKYLQDANEFLDIQGSIPSGSMPSGRMNRKYINHPYGSTFKSYTSYNTPTAVVDTIKYADGMVKTNHATETMASDSVKGIPICDNDYNKEIMRLDAKGGQGMYEGSAPNCTFSVINGTDYRWYAVQTITYSSGNTQTKLDGRLVNGYKEFVDSSKNIGIIRYFNDGVEKKLIATRMKTASFRLWTNYTSIPANSDGNFATYDVTDTSDPRINTLTANGTCHNGAKTTDYTYSITQNGANIIGPITIAIGILPYNNTGSTEIEYGVSVIPATDYVPY